MPLYQTITVNNHTKVLIWNILEPFQVLYEATPLSAQSEERLLGMKSQLHQRGFLSVRHLLAVLGYTDFDLIYNTNGKPFLKDGKKISITHSYTFSAIIVSDEEVGIDIEMQRAKILKIAPKFTPIEEYRTLANEEALIRKLTMVWGAKESLYKSFAQPGLGFLKHIEVHDFEMEDIKTTAMVYFKRIKQSYMVWFKEFEGFTMAYALINK